MSYMRKQNLLKLFNFNNSLEMNGSKGFSEFLYEPKLLKSLRRQGIFQKEKEKTY